MPENSTTTFSNPDGYQAGLRVATINVVLTSPGLFSAHLTSAVLPHLKLYSVQESLPHTAYVSLTPKTVNFVLSLSGPPPIWGGAEIKSQDLMFHSVGERIHQRTRGAGSWGIISVDPAFFAQSSKALTGSEIIPPPVGQVLRPSRVVTNELRRLHAKACRLVETNPKAVAHREVARAIEHYIIYALVNCLTAHVVHGDTAARRRCATIMSRFEEVLATKFDRQLPMPMLCKSMGVPERTLRMCCIDVIGTSPSRYIRLRRLNLVRNALRWSGSATTKISEIAAVYGFSELGRFAASYRAIFGETPSATLRNARPKSQKIRNIQIARNE
jgi:AraC-like DNA-binding protein